MPAARALWVGTGEAHEATGDVVVLEHMQLLLPSSLPLALQQSAGLLSLVDKEFQLRHAQADDALIPLQQSLCALLASAMAPLPVCRWSAPYDKV